MKTNYPDNINPAALLIISKHILPALEECKEPLRKKDTVFLELGCSTGSLGFHVLRNHKNIYWTGLDFNTEALGIASTRLSAVGWSDFNDLQTSDLTRTGPAPDYIVLIDVLEHVYEPTKLLSTIKKSFSNASIICVLPNISCHQTYAMLAANDFSYEEYGIFDKTHKTFYSPYSAIDFFSNMGYTAKLGPVFLPDPEVAALLSSKISYPYSFNRQKYTVRVDSRFELLSLCSYGFGLLLSPRQ